MPRKQGLTKGQLNKLVDTLTHPYFRRHPITILVDEAAHLIIERDPETSLAKFVEYNLPLIMRTLKKRSSTRTKKRLAKRAP